MSDDIIILTFSIIGIIAGIFGLVYLGYRHNYIEFLKFRHWMSLFVLVVAGILTWFGMVYIVNPSLKITGKQWLSFGFSVAISLLWWMRYVYTVQDNIDEEE